jgi:hypothetical protein
MALIIGIPDELLRVNKSRMGRPKKYDQFDKLEPNSYMEIEFESEGQMRSIRSAYLKFRRKYHPEWVGSVRLWNEKIAVIRFS